MVKFVKAREIDRLLRFDVLINALKEAFAAPIEVPVRSHHTIRREGAADATLLLMPAWSKNRGGFMGTKIVSVFPDNAELGKPSVVGIYILFAGDSGEVLVTMDGPRLTLWRTAAASALASLYLSRPDARHLLMVGAGALSPFLIKAHHCVRPIETISIWNRNAEKAQALARALRKDGIQAKACEDLEEAVRQADIISSATMTPTALIKGAWLKEGAHLDLVGAYRPNMRESDDETIGRAKLYCDTKAGALKEGGDLADPLMRGLIGLTDIRGDLFELVRGEAIGRQNERDITLFKSVGTAIEDLAAAMLVWRQLSR